MIKYSNGGGGGGGSGGSDSVSVIYRGASVSQYALGVPTTTNSNYFDSTTNLPFDYTNDGITKTWLTRNTDTITINETGDYKVEMDLRFFNTGTTKRQVSTWFSRVPAGGGIFNMTVHDNIGHYSSSVAERNGSHFANSNPNAIWDSTYHFSATAGDVYAVAAATNGTSVFVGRYTYEGAYDPFRWTDWSALRQFNYKYHITKLS